MSSAGTQNVLMFSGSIAGVATFWLLLLGFQNGSALQIAGGVITAVISVFCFRGYAAALRADRERGGRDR